MASLALAILAAVATSSAASNILEPHPDLSLQYYNATYSQANATRCLYFAYGAYCSQASLESWTCKWCQYIPNFKVANVTQTDYLQAFVGFDVQYDQIVISFRGTHNVEDWLDDLDALQVAYPGVTGGYVHKGFYDSWTKELMPSIMAAAEGLMNTYKGKPILVTGHSLGAALAQLCAIDVSKYAASKSNAGLIYLYTYGSPRWANDVMVNYFEGMIGFHWRLVNLKDVVPTVPYQDMGDHSKYHHTFTEIWYTKDSPLVYTQCDGSGEDKKCNYIGYSVEDHLHYLNIYESCS